MLLLVLCPIFGIVFMVFGGGISLFIGMGLIAFGLLIGLYHYSFSFLMKAILNLHIPAKNPELTDELASEAPEMRFEAARACGELQLAGAVPRLSQMTADLDLEVKLAAIGSLGRIGGPEARRVLDICVEMGDEAMVEAAREALDEMDYMEEEIDLDLYSYDSDDDPEDEDELEDGFEFGDLGATYGGATYGSEDDDDDDDELDYWEDEDPYQ